MPRAFHQPPGRENARGFKEYTRVKATLAQITDGAVLLAVEDKVPAWVPRGALDAASRALIHRSAKGSEVVLAVEVPMALAKNIV